MSEKILLTGASGFIGTNLLEDLLAKGYEVKNLDWNEPKIPARKNLWENVNIINYEDFEKAVVGFNPDYIVHLAARTDLDGKTLEDYDQNITGVENLMKIIHKLPNLKKIIITSSKFVTRNGYKIKNQHDYCPHTKYGESKVETEIRVWNDAPDCDWCIIRPTSIWGPWFGVPYRNFFDMVMRRMYFHIGHIKCHKTYGYIGNAIYQIEQLLFNETKDENNKVFYIGDEPSYEINEWADEIAAELGFKVPTMPVWFVKCLAKFGDFLGLFHIHFPMQSFRFGNMTNDGINDMSNTYKIAPEMPYTRLEGTKETIAWINKYEKERESNMTAADSLIGLVNPKPNSTVMIYDVHASESGALAILDDLYKQIRAYTDKSVKWVFIVSTPHYEETKEITVRRFPWVKKNWGYRYYFDTVTTRKLLNEFKPDKVFSLQNKGIDFYNKEQLVYLHLPFILTDHKFSMKVDGKKLWAYQNIISKSIFRSLRKVDMTIVQTQWMKDALVKKAGVNADKIVIQQPDIKCNDIKRFEDCSENRKRIFYPATSFTYKNHRTLLKALDYAQRKGLKDYEVIFTIRPNENECTRQLQEFAEKNNLNVKFNGPIPREKVFEMYAKSILVFPSYVESFGLPLLEAKLTGTYILASDTPFCREILNGYNKAEFFEEMDYKKLGDQILLRMQ